ncbi:4-hydroxybenzoate octaprenyltransferase [Legionella jordanis]|uniref:4-hydroxybenzoate octaprenyltransferase n=2 Tax=Legionella jordanis TaxID=456 RepID=A0A0W0VA96_9GAMM|nr:4-hydroxybenzoate octaprenyltransferase [Legionella jordanis]KTD17077.1 4-hydroxybenzoate-octaprenyltransferase [Legionella jordanis]RMX03210.1 4-hydroxybenzoate octaprenyltransferase [Legionella jordanis]RMX18650.1 4-hydroxybenzoate octaprenyltransferase [Legionella jordanis]VEH12726.1 4-hydroxybenzoate-octaprenyltransferase [Legionella jordanis]
MNWRAYLSLMRFDKPIGILLLWWPTAWALWLANAGQPSKTLVGLFFLGTTLMRAAGCVMNDIADRNIDRHVQRTKNRPLTSGQLSLQEALAILFVLLLGSLVVLTQLPKECFYYALIAVFITILYPFCKRFLQSPQLVLSIAFSMGIPMVYAASNQSLDKTMWLLMLINALWIIAYDTEYAMVDREDDLKIGVKSTAILFASYDRLVIGLLQVLFHLLWLPLALDLASGFFWCCWLLASFNLLLQQKLLANRKSQDCFKAFLSNNYYGLLMWSGIVLSRWN